MIRVGWLSMRPPILHLTTHKLYKRFSLFLSFFYKVLSYVYTKGGSTLLKFRNGGRSLNISIEKYTLCSYSLIMIQEDYGHLKRNRMIKIKNHVSISRVMIEIVMNNCVLPSFLFINSQQFLVKIATLYNLLILVCSSFVSIV